jgi:hypothetical protein
MGKKKKKREIKKDPIPQPGADGKTVEAPKPDAHMMMME